MIEKPPLKDQSIVDCLAINYGIQVTTLRFLPIGLDMNAAVYKAATQDGLTYFIKLKRGHHQDISTVIIDLLHAAGVQQIIFPIKTIHGQLTEHVEDFTLIVSPFIEGQDGFNRDLSDEQWVTLGKVLRQVHTISVPPAIKTLLRKETYLSQWREAVRELYSAMNSKTSGDEYAQKLRVFMQERKELILQLVNRAEQLAQEIQQKKPELVLCHSDIHGGNVLIENNGAIYLVDWDEPMMAPKERDLMFIGAGVANVWNKPHEQEFFYQGYGETKIDKVLLAYYRCERIVEDIALLGRQLFLTMDERGDKAELFKHFVAQFEPLGVVDVAVNTEY